MNQSLWTYANIGTMDVRLATDDDHSALFEIHKEVFEEHIEQIWSWDEAWQRANFAAELNSTVTSVIEINGRVGGYIQVRDEEDRIYLQNIALSSAFQGKGFGGKLVEDIQNKAKSRGVSLELAVFRTNSRARRFYECCGFRIVGKTDEFVEMSWNGQNTPIQ
jgi:ribosomal protein S18 acetylase RimI-like enzyme